MLSLQTGETHKTKSGRIDPPMTPKTPKCRIGSPPVGLAELRLAEGSAIGRHRIYLFAGVCCPINRLQSHPTLARNALLPNCRPPLRISTKAQGRKVFRAPSTRPSSTSGADGFIVWETALHATVRHSGANLDLRYCPIPAKSYCRRTINRDIHVRSRRDS